MKNISACLLLSSLVLSAATYAQSTCGNRDFEDQNFNNWTGQTGTNTGSSSLSWSGGYISTVPDDAVGSSSRQTIITINAADPIAQDPSFTTMAPSAGSTVIRLGNTITGAEAEGVKCQFAVTTTDTVFTYQYACVFEDPGHSLLDQPGFAVNVYDQNNILIPSLCDTIYSGDPQYAFLTSTNPMGVIRYKKWSGVSIDLGAYAGQTVTIEFNNFDCALGGHFGYTYLDAMCQGTWVTSVWPGDCDYDLVADDADLLSLGIAYGATGTARPSASTSWVAQPSPDWSQNFQLGANYKHCDTDGNGTVDMNDTAAIFTNYGSMHAYRFAAPVADPLMTAPLYLVASTDTMSPYVPVTVDIMLNASLYGAAFTITYDHNMIDSASMMVNYSNSWFGTAGNNMLKLDKNFYGGDYLDMALTRIDHNNISGNGKIASLTFTPKPGAPAGPLNLGVVGVYAVNNAGQPVPLTGSGDAIYYNPLITTVPSLSFEQLFTLYPNPSNGVINFTSQEDEWTLELLNSLGQQVYSTKGVRGNVIIEPGVKPGIYFTKVSCAKGIFIQRVLVTE